MRVNDILCTSILCVLLLSLHASKKDESCSVPPPNDFYDLFSCRLYNEWQYVIDKDPTDPIRTKIEKFITKASSIYVSSSASNQEGSATTSSISRSTLPSNLVSTPSAMVILPDTTTISTKSSVYNEVNDELPKSYNSTDKGSINATLTSDAIIQSTKEALKSSSSHSSSSHAGDSGIKSMTVPSKVSTSGPTAKKTQLSDTLDLAIPSRPNFDDSFLDWRYPDLDDQILHLEIGDNTFESQSDSRHFPSFEEWRKNALLKEGQAAEGIYWHKKRTNKPDAESILSNLEDVGVDTADVLEGQHYNSLPEEVTGPEILVKEKPNASSASSTPISDSRDSKDRFNYASFDCAATVMAANTEAKGATAILMESKDQYMLNICSANKYVIVELCDEILVDTVALANYEFFASTFKDFRVYVSDRYPPKGDGWKLLGEFHGKNTRDLQTFRIDRSSMWARYIKIEFLNHYGEEYYCPVSLLRVHGTTMMEEYRREEESRANRGAPISVTVGKAQSSAVHTPISDLSVAVSHTSSLVQNVTPRTDNVPAYMTSTPSSSLSSTPSSIRKSSIIVSPHETNSSQTDAILHQSSAITSSISATTGLPSATSELTDGEQGNETSMLKASSVYPSSARPDTPTPTPVASSPSSPAATLSVPPKLTPPETSSNSESTSSSQENIFKTITKRLNNLEFNATLSVRYLEEQAKALNELMKKMEVTHQQRLTNVVMALNKGILKKFKTVLQDYESLRSTVRSEMQYQRETINLELQETRSRINVLYDEIQQRKRWETLQFMLLFFALFGQWMKSGIKAFWKYTVGHKIKSGHSSNELKKSTPIDGTRALSRSEPVLSTNSIPITALHSQLFVKSQPEGLHRSHLNSSKNSTLQSNNRSSSKILGPATLSSKRSKKRKNKGKSKSQSPVEEDSVSTSVGSTTHSISPMVPSNSFAETNDHQPVANVEAGNSRLSSKGNLATEAQDNIFRPNVGRRRSLSDSTAVYSKYGEENDDPMAEGEYQTIVEEPVDQEQKPKVYQYRIIIDDKAVEPLSQALENRTEPATRLDSDHAAPNDTEWIGVRRRTKKGGTGRGESFYKQ